MAYKDAHYYHGTVPQPRCGGTSGQSNAELVKKVATLEAAIDALTTANQVLSARFDALADNNCCEKLTKQVEQLSSQAVKRSDLVEETHTSFDENDTLIHTLRFKGN